MRKCTLFTKQATDSPQHTVLFWVVWVVFAWYLENRREGCGVGIDSMADLVGNLRDRAHKISLATATVC